MQSSQIVPGNSAHEALATLTRFRSRPFWGSFCMCKARTELHCIALRRTTIGFRSCLPRQTNIDDCYSRYNYSLRHSDKGSVSFAHITS